MSVANLERVCFLLHLRADRVDDYLAAHKTVWPEMLEALRQTGWRNYSLFLRPNDGLVVGYLETDDFAAATAAMDATDVNDRWQRSMAEFFDAPAGGVPHRLAEYFHLE